MTPKTKKLLSAFAVTIGGALLVLLNAYVVRLPAELQGFAGAVLAGGAHFINAWGTQDEVNKEVSVKVAEIVEMES